MATEPKSPQPYEDLLAQTRWLGRLAAQLVPPADREDLVQDVLVSAMRTKSPTHLRGWLATVARNLATRRRSSERNRTLREQSVARKEGAEPSAADALEAFASHRAVVNAVMELKEPYRTAVLLRFWEDLPPREVARRTGVPVETARTRIKRGVDHLRAELDQQPGGRSAWVLPLLQIGGVREAFLAGTATAGTVGTAASTGTAGTMASFPILTGVLAMKKVALATVAVVSVVATVVVFTYGDAPVDKWPGSGRTGTQHAGTAIASETEPTGERAAPSTDRTALGDMATGAATDAGLSVTVLDRFGNPAEGATVWRWRDFEADDAPTEKAEGRVTDAQGRVRLPSGASAGGIVVLAKDHVVAVRRLASLAGAHQVRLQAGARVQGWIRVDGEAPTEPITLRLGGGASKGPLGELPHSLREVVGDFRRENHHVIKTTAHGAFEFTGLGESWRGSIRLPMHLWLRGECLERCLQKDGSPRYYGLAKPQTGVQVDTTALPGLRGRVVWDDTNQGVPNAAVNTCAVLPSGKGTSFTGLHTDEDGYFRLGFGPGSRAERRAWVNAEDRGPIRKIRLWVSKAGARQVEREILDPEKLDPPGYLELRLQRAIRLHFLAVDTDGKPVPGAVLLGARCSGPSNAEGRGTVEVRDVGRRRFLGGAPGHMVAEVEARTGVGTSESPLELVLKKGNKVVVVVRDADQRPPQGLYVSVRSKQPLFTGPEEGRPSRLHPVVGSRFRQGSWGHGKMDFQYPLDETGFVVLESLRPKVPFQVAVLDKLHQDVLVRDTVSPAAEEVKRIELRLEEKIQDFTGLVVDVHDRPIPHAQVSVTVGGHGNTRSTDAHGRFRFEGVYPTGKPLTLKISRRGYVRAERKGVAITKEIKPIKIRLLPGYDVKLTFVDSEGVRLPVMWCEVAGNIEAETERLEPGLLLAKDLTAGPQVFKAYIGGRNYELRHDPAASNTAQFVLPVMGRIQVEVPRPTKLTPYKLRAVVTARSDGKSFEASFTKGADEPTITTSERLLLPGKYSVEVRVRADAGRQLLYPARQMTIKPGTLSRCRFGER